MSENEIENERPDIIVNLVEKNQEGQELKILTPNQMLSRLPIDLAHLKAGKIQKNLKMK